MMLSSCSLLRAISAYYLFANPKQLKTEDNNRSWYHVWLHQGQPMDSTTWPGNMPNHNQSHSFHARRGFQHWVGKYSLPFIFSGTLSPGLYNIGYRSLLGHVAILAYFATLGFGLGFGLGLRGSRLLLRHSGSWSVVALATRLPFPAVYALLHSSIDGIN